MQYASCFVQLSGDLGTNIAKAPVTPAEVVVLRAIHGPEAVSKVELLNGGVNDKASHAEELERLRQHYTAVDKDGNPIVNLLFAGYSPKLPTTFDEIGIAIGGDEPRSAKGKKAAAKNAAEAKSTEADEDEDTNGGDA